MPRGVVIAITPSKKSVQADEEVQELATSDTSAENAAGAEIESAATADNLVRDGAGAAEEDQVRAGCYGTVRIEETNHEHNGKVAKFVIPRGSRQQPCCSKKRGDEVTVGNIREEKDGLHADIIGNC
ncbi:hypothetical protein SAMN04487941_0228 [Pontibacter akesuensis]|uniref:Uncharacterized protein n=2 Tax=Pontibacter akesuensis TaxID=388950 RepID=A0A1I7FIN4_9BACT|nr:hypothetical protein SAMN04487941_0228 [Pontibacter akesuensis]